MTLSEWDGTPWGGSAVAIATPEQLRVPEAKAVVGPFAGRVEYGNYLTPSARTPQEMMRRAQAAYRRHPWIGTAEATVTRRAINLPWHIEDEADEEYEEPFPAAVKIAWDLLEKPQAGLEPKLRQAGLQTGRNLRSITSRHAGLCGVSYWYLDQVDGNGSPLAILYVNPARVWPVETDGGRIIGWVLDPKDDTGRGGTPLELEELLPFYLDAPDRGAAPSGLYERVLIKAQLTGIADQHAAYVLGTGGRIAGIVSPKEGSIGPDDYAALVNEFRNVNESPDAAKRTTVSKGPLEFTKTAANPNELDLAELERLNRDDIFAVWQVPPSQAGIAGGTVGMNSGETRQYEEATLMQGAVHDRVVMLRDTIQFGLLDRWQPTGYTIDLEIEEPEFDDRVPLFEMAAKAANVPLTNAERRDLLGLDPFGDDRDAEVWLPATYVLAYGAGQTASEPEPPPPAVLPGTPLPALNAGPQPAVAPEAPPAKSERREFLGLRQTIGTRWVPQVRRTVADVLAAQRKDVVAKLRATSPDELARQRRNRQHWFARDREADRMRRALRPVIAGIAETVASRTDELLRTADGKADVFTDRVLAEIVGRVGSRIAGITDTTEQAIADAIGSGYEQGLSPRQIADLIDGLPAFDEARAELVARTETMFAYNAAALSSYDAYGIREVEAIDGDKDEACAARDGQTYGVLEAYDIQDHPNGTLDWVPVLGKADSEGTAMVKAILALAERQPVVNVYQSPITVEAQPTPAVYVQPAQVTFEAGAIQNAPVAKAVRKVVERDAKGQVTAIVEQPDGN